MAQKTNKSYTKRLRITRNGKILSRKPGQNHFNAKESRSAQLKKHGLQGSTLIIKNKIKSTFVPHE
jgi:ribosomal protein L35